MIPVDGCREVSRPSVPAPSVTRKDMLDMSVGHSDLPTADYDDRQPDARRPPSVAVMGGWPPVVAGLQPRRVANRPPTSDGRRPTTDPPTADCRPPTPEFVYAEGHAPIAETLSGRRRGT